MIFAVAAKMWKKAVFHIVVIAICLGLMIGRVLNLAVESFPQTKQGFICGDPSLSLTFKPNTVSYDWLATINYIAPCFVAVIEVSIHGRTNLRNLMVTAIRCIMWIQQYYFVNILFFLTMLFIKGISGYLRPYFLKECMPDLAINCTNGEFFDSNYICTNPNISDFVQFQYPKSFPSGNTMVSTYPMVFIIWYLQKRLSKVPLVVPILAIIATWWVLFNAITRITDHTHHKMDVIGAFIILSPFVVYLNFKACKNFKTSSKLDVNEFKCLGIIKCSSCKGKRNNKD